jgi:gliding motility-associated-like protein
MGCSAQFSFNVSTDYVLEVQAGPSVTIKQGQETQLTATANGDHGNTYTWTPSTSLSCDNCASTWASPQQTTVYTVYAVDSNGCKANAVVTVEVNTTHTVFIPNAFTPNNDGNNDQFQIFGDLYDITFMQVALFNRWGEKVFESNDPSFKWDGTYKGEPAPEGVYVYMMQVVFGDGSKQDYKGSETLLR